VVELLPDLEEARGRDPKLEISRAIKRRYDPSSKSEPRFKRGVLNIVAVAKGSSVRAKITAGNNQGSKS
jgi:hypothetical protein